MRCVSMYKQPFAVRQSVLKFLLFFSPFFIITGHTNDIVSQLLECKKGTQRLLLCVAVIRLTSSLLLSLKLSSERPYMHMNWHYSVMAHSKSYAQLQIKPFAWMELRCMWGISVCADHETDSSSCKQVKPWRADWLHTAFACTHTNAHTRTHARIVRYTPGPLERALVTPHKSI